MDQALNSQKTPHTSPLRASYGMSFVSILMKNDRVIKGFYCSLCFTATIALSMMFRFHIYNYKLNVSSQNKHTPRRRICYSHITPLTNNQCCVAFDNKLLRVSVV